MIRAHPKASIPTLKPSSTQEPTSSRARQEHRPELYYTGCPKSHQTHRHLKTHYWTLHCTPQRGNPAPPTRTPDTSFPNQETLISYSSNSTTERNLHNKEEPQTARIQKGHPKHSNLNKMKRQRNTQQIKEYDKSPPNQTKEEEIGSLPEKEFRIMIVKMMQNLENKELR